MSELDLTPIIAFVREFQKAMDRVLGPGTEGRAFLERLARDAPHIEKRLKDLPAEAQDAFLQAGFPPCNRINLGGINKIATTFVNDGPAASTALIENTCLAILAGVEERNRMLSDWKTNAHLTKRIGILEEALSASAAGFHNIAIPAFLAQLEGLVADSRSASGSMNFAQFQAQLATLASKDDLFGPHLERFVRQVVLSHFSHGAPVTSDLSRHAILHGGETSYGTERNSARVIMLFDYIQELVRI
jgi:hypothetical protein